ncbi:MAG TPA: NAD(P)-dependent oxidoreductase [Gemmatimonadaceae bacterium]|nr:NAD(P)-dependent oxidoreductase [Gemmatimonadaceae bacterium]
MLRRTQPQRVPGVPLGAPPPNTEQDLEQRLAEPTPGVLEALRAVPGDIIVLGAAGKMGPSLARMARRALDALGRSDRVIAASRFSSPESEHRLRASNIETIRCDLTDREAVGRLPDAPNVLFLAGQKFGTSGAPAETWAMNTIVPHHAAERYASSRIVAFSTGNVYPLVPVGSGGAREEDAPAPVGEYAASCLGRERVFEFHAARRGTRVAIMRLNYAVDLRYGVLVDVARRVWRGEPVDVTMGWVNVIWQGDANARALQCLAHAASPPFVVNVTGRDTLSIRAAAQRFGEMFGRPAAITGEEAPDALLSDATRSMELFGPPTVSTGQLIAWVADWIQRGGTTLDRPTHYEVRTGQF